MEENPKNMSKNWNLGGISDSKRQGTENSSYTIKNGDIHSDPGVIKCHQGLEDDGTGTKPDEDVVSIVHSRVNDYTYFFGKNGSVWVRNNSDVYSLLGNIPEGTGYGLIYDAKEFNGDIYYTMQERVGKYTPSASWNDSTTDGTQNNFKNIEFDSFHPLKVVNNDLFVGHTNKIGKIEATTTAGGDIDDVLTLDTRNTIESLGGMSRYLIVGTRRIKSGGTTFAGFSRLYKWDLVSDTYSSEQEIPEFGISAFIEHRGALLLSAGQNGNLYSFDGNFATRYRRFPGSTTDGTSVLKNAYSAKDGITLIGVSQTGTSGVYSLGGYDAKYPDVFNLPFCMASAEIGCIEWAGDDLLIAYTIGSADYVKKVSTTLATAETESLIQTLVNDKGVEIVPSPVVEYESYPAGTDVQLYVSVNRGSYVELELDKTTKGRLTSRKVLNGREIQYKLILTPSGTSTPIIEFYG